MRSSAVTMGHLQQNIDTISNNLSNINTIGYRRREDMFSDILFQQINNQEVPQPEGNRLTPVGIRAGNGAGVIQTALRHELGTVHETDRALDFALTEPGSYFPIQTEVDGVIQQAFTRDGAFYLSEAAPGADTWQLVTQTGGILTDGNEEPFEVPGHAIDFHLQSDGTLVAELTNGEATDIGVLEIANITRPQLLENMGENLFQLPDLAALDVDEADVLGFEAVAENHIMQGALEQSNVDMTTEMTNLMEMQRAYSLHARNITQYDEMMGLINGLR
ncbi:flagellar basal-body rod protein FlgG [Geomicrobium halophilum]|uniref:Flagellar basal-body rod protein FlgG n=1 Tax=Geomicrobium halophilum TaxID=549000 RepID=A0A841PZW2_9BACL|nr:flagellar basal-body rod protein FlgG [Geomicrobium halophilum]